ncbi:response regulator [Paenibacillus residui]|uniref:Response regulator n=1 Tax=Paenibacillus residui TaxID=629724 RepID=A0ABW3D8A4_9BACL
MKIKLLIVDDHLIVINGLKYYFQTKPNIDVVGYALNGEEALQQVEAVNPDIVLMDIQMPHMNGIEATKQIVQRFPAVKVIILTSFSDRDSIIPAIKAGAIGYQLKDVDPDVLTETIFAAMDGQKVIHPEIANKLMTFVASEAEADFRFNRLTSKEKEVLYHITLGQSNKEIAAELHIADKTVKTHISNILSKMEVQDRTQAALYTLRNGWFE